MDTPGTGVLLYNPPLVAGKLAYLTISPGPTGHEWFLTVLASGESQLRSCKLKERDFVEQKEPRTLRAPHTAA
jgi:hypothetical protein